MLFRNTSGGALEITEDPAAEPVHVPLDFAHVSSLRWCDERGELLVSATPEGAPRPSVGDDARGERRLFAFRPREGWRQIGSATFAADPVATRDRYIASRGAGISVFGADGTVLHEYKKGRFNWGPPSLSVSTDGGYVAWVRWRGDAKKLCVMNLGDYGVTEYVHSLYRYAWLDDRQLVFLLGGPPRVLDAVTGEARPFLPERYAEVAVAGERVWLTSEPRDTVFECTVDGSNLEVAWREERSLADRLKRETRRVDTIVPFADDSGWILLEVYRRRYTVVRREERWVGRVRDHAGGWAPLLNCHQPDFGFMLPGD